jgi:uncharacterized iron-regulated membrane protein
MKLLAETAICGLVVVAIVATTAPWLLFRRLFAERVWKVTSTASPEEVIAAAALKAAVRARDAATQAPAGGAADPVPALPADSGEARK